MDSNAKSPDDKSQPQTKTTEFIIEQGKQLTGIMSTMKTKSGSKRKKLKERKSVEGDAIMCDISDQDYSIFLAISFGKIHRVERALAETDISIRNNEMQTPLIYATNTTSGPLCNHLVRTLLAHGSDVNAQDEHGRTALMYACADNDNEDAVRLLIRNTSCDPNLVDCEGNTALMFAVAADSVSSVEVLLKHRKIRHKVDVNITNCIGLTALDMAVALKAVECCKLIYQTSGQKIKKIDDEKGLYALIGIHKHTSESAV